MIYCQIKDEESQKHILKLIGWLFDEVSSAGGDGDGLWYSKYYDVKDIYPLVEKFLQSDKSFKFWALSADEKTIFASNHQEFLTITNDENLWNNAPSWQQVLIKY